MIVSTYINKVVANQYDNRYKRIKLDSETTLIIQKISVRFEWNNSLLRTILFSEIHKEAIISSHIFYYLKIKNYNNKCKKKWK